MLKRLPQSEGMTVFSLLFSVIFIAGGAYLGYKHIDQFKKVEKIRTEALDLNNLYVKENIPNTLKVSVSLEHKGETFSATSNIVLKNTSDITIDKLILNLNKGLKISSLKVEGEELQFVRKHHLILVNNKINIEPGAESKVEISYEGTIDEAFCYLDID